MFARPSTSARLNASTHALTISRGRMRTSIAARRSSPERRPRGKGRVTAGWFTPLKSASTFHSSFLSSERRGESKRSLDCFHKISLFAEDEPFGLCHRKVLACFRIRLQARPIGLVACETFKSNQPPSHVVRAFIREKIPDQVAAASGNDTAPILGVRLESVFLERIDFVANDADHTHWYPPRRQVE